MKRVESLKVCFDELAKLQGQHSALTRVVADQEQRLRRLEELSDQTRRGR